jgi:Lar family restriction alleviation protein
MTDKALAARLRVNPLPCPFCGGTNIEVVEGDTFRWRLACCRECGAQAGEVRIQTLGDGTPEEWEADAASRAIEEWNRRSEK